MANNARLGGAKSAKNDEFYTQLSDIENELKNYREHFKGKTVFCNCDDPFESNFFKFFVLRFNSLSLKKLIATSYSGSPIMGQQLSLFDVTGSEEARKKPYKAVVTKVRDTTGNGGVDMLDIANLFKSGENELSELKGNGEFSAGDFRSDECIALLKEADIVATNPPFSLFREYVAQLVEFDKKFVIIGNKNAITYKEIFPLIKENKLWVGVTPMTKDLRFISPPKYVDELIKSGRASSYVVKDGVYLTRSPSIWYTNLEHTKRNAELFLHKEYRGHEGDYPKYDNYDAINVDKTDGIPKDYDGVMGVPITFLDKYNPEQFEIVGATESEGKGFSNGLWDKSSGVAQPVIKGNRVYKRLFIRRKAGNGG